MEVKIPAVQLFPILPSHNPKYNRSLRLGPETALAVIPRLGGAWTLTDNQIDLPAGWECLVTPEGDSYWHDSDRKIVSHADPSKPIVATLINAAYENIRNEINDWENIEVFFNTSQEAPETPTSGALGYYLINHSNRQVFWVEDVKTDKIRIGPVSSSAQLRSALVSEYWTHIDYFPCHRVVDESAKEELLNVLRHGAIDDLTAPGSTFPYSAEEARKYLSFLEGFKTKDSSSSATESAYKTASFARIWSSITRVRHINGHGLKNPRLDRLQGLEDYSYGQARRSFKLGLAEVACFNMPRQLFGRMTALWNGRIVYQRHWHTLFDELRREWELLALINIVMVIASVISSVMAAAELLLLNLLVLSAAGGGAVLSILLHKIHQRSGLATASDISAYISYAENYHHGLRGLSVVLSLPRALTIWGTIFLQVALTAQAITLYQYTDHWAKPALAGIMPVLLVLPTLSFFRYPV